MDNVESIYPLSPMQLDILLRALQAPELHEYVEQICWTLRGDFHPDVLAEAWSRVVARNTMLRTAFFYEGLDRPVQVVREHVEMELTAEDWRGLPAHEQEERFRRALREDRDRDFAPEAAPLLRLLRVRVADDAWRFAWSYHHLALDGWSAELCLREVFAVYQALAGGGAPRLEPAVPYRRYMLWLERQDETRAEAFWRAVLAGVERPTSLPPWPEGHDGVSASHGVVTVAFPEELSEALRHTARRLQLSLNTVCEGAWAILLSRYAGSDDVLFGSVDSGRPGDLPGAESMLGLFIRTLPVRARVEPGVAASAWLSGLQRQQQKARLHNFVPMSRIAGWGGLPQGQRPFESFFVFQNLPDFQLTHASVGTLELTGFERLRPDGGFFALKLTVHPLRAIRVELGYDAAYAPGAMQRLLGHYRTLLETIAADPECPVDGLPMLTAEERRQVLEEWNDTAAAYPAERCIHELFEAQVERSPEAVAVVFAGRALTYAGLNARANRLAHHLRGRGVGPGARVALCVERSLEMMVAVLGALKAGGTFVPLDPAYPVERLRHMLEDSAPSALLTRGSLAGLFSGTEVPVVGLEAEWGEEPETNPGREQVGVTPDHVAYVTYTSGSTGLPKGVWAVHRKALNLIHWYGREFGVSERDRVLVATSYSFDGTYRNLFAPLFAGGSCTWRRSRSTRGGSWSRSPGAGSA